MDCRIGLHLGPVTIDFVGKGTNTVPSDAVNIAFRIEGLTRLVDEPILTRAAFVEGFSGLAFAHAGGMR
jgi:adenylate cyclase